MQTTIDKLKELLKENEKLIKQLDIALKGGK